MVVTIDTLTDDLFCSTNKIREGPHREVYLVEDSIVKVLKPFRRKNYGMFHITFPTGLYTLLKFGIKDFNEYEQSMYNQLMSATPKDYHRNFSTVYETGYHNGRSISISELVYDSNGNISPSIADCGQIPNQSFWKRLKELEEMFVSIRFYPMDLEAKNILVRSDEARGWEPVFIDFKRIGARTYPFQAGFYYKPKLIERMRRKFVRLRDKHQSK